jgi:hypothetical protein
LFHCVVAASVGVGELVNLLLVEIETGSKFLPRTLLMALAVYSLAARL